MTGTRIHLDGRKWASLALIPSALVLIVMFTVLDLRVAIGPPFLLPILNTVFIGIIPLVIAAIAFRSYRSGGSASLFMMGCGMMIFGLGSIAAGWLIGLPGGANISVAIYNVCILLSAVFFLSGALLTFTRSKTPETRGDPWKIAVTAAAIIIFVAVFIVLDIAGSIPPFFIAGSGPTVLRQVILSNAIVILAIAGILLFHGYQQKREDFFFWYSVSLAVIAVGLVAALFTPALGSPVNWVSRVMQYIGAGFALVAIIVAGRLARDRGRSLEETLSRFFSDAEAGYRSLVETATDAIVVFDSADRVLVWNRAAEKMFGYSSSEAIGSSFFGQTVPDEFTSTIKNNFRIHESGSPDSAVHKPVEITVRRKDGSRFPAEVTLSRHMVGGTEVSTCIIRDLTARKMAEEQLRENDSILHGFFDSPGVMRGIVEVIADDDVCHLMDNSVTAEFIGNRSDALKNKRGSELGEPRDILKLWVDHYRQSQETGSKVSFEYSDKRGDREAWLSATVSYLGTSSGGYPRFAYIVQDVTAHRLAKERLKQSEEKYRTIVETANEGIWVVDAGLMTTFVNEKMARIFGYTPEEMLGRSAFDFMDDEGRALATQRLEQRVKGERGNYEHKYIRKDGSPVWTYANVTPLKDSTGRFVGSIGMLTDITSRRQAEDALRESEERFRLVFDSMIETFVIVEPVYDGGDSPVDFRFIETNSANNRRANMRRDEIVGKRLLELFPIASREVVRAMKAVIETEKPVHVEYYSEVADRYIELHAWSPVKGQVAAISLDITGRRNAEDALRESEERFRSVLDNSRDFIYRANLQTGTYEYVSPSVKDVLGYTPGEFAALDFPATIATIHPDDLAAVTAKLKRLEETGAGELEYRLRNKQGEYLWVSNYLTVSRDSSGQLLYRDGNVRDVTERRKAEDALRESEDRFRAIAETVPAIVGVTRIADATILFTNEASDRAFGVEVGSVVGTKGPDYYCDPADREKVFALFRKQGFVDSYMAKVKKRDGTPFWVTTSIRPITFGGEPAIIGAAIDITGQKVLEEELNRSIEKLSVSEERLRLAQEAGNVGIWDWDLLTAEVRWTPELDAIYGLKPGSIRTYQDFRDKIHPDDIGRVEKAQSDAVDRHKPFEYEFRFTRPEGEIGWVYCRGGALYNEEGKPVRQFGVNIDITERKRTEEALRVSEERFRAVQENTLDHFTIVKPFYDDRGEIVDFTYVWTNAPAARGSGRRPDEYPGRRMGEFYPYYFQGHFFTMFKQAMETGQVTEFEDHYNGHGLDEWFFLRVTPIPGAVAIATQTITGRKRAEAALRENEERFRELAEKAGSIILRFDTAGRITYFNEFAENFFGYSRDEVLGKPAVGLILPETESGTGRDLDGMVREIVANPEQYASNINENIRKNGERVWVQWTNKPVFNPDGTIREFTTIGNDITARKLAEDALRENEARLRAALAEKEVLLAEIHHRVKNNLTAFISLLSLEGSTEETLAGRELKKDLQNRARSMALIHETLYRTHKFSEVDMDAYLTPLVDQIVKSYSSAESIRTLVEAKGVALDLARATPAGLIVNELVTNSLKHAFPKDAIACRTDMKDPCTIRIVMAGDNGSYLMKVCDNGIGMPAGFDPLAAKSLGLKLVTFLARHQMRATISVKSSKKGTEFMFRFEGTETAS